MIRAMLPEGYYIHYPIYENILIGDDMLSCERWPEGRRKKCRINGRFVSQATYESVSNPRSTDSQRS